MARLKAETKVRVAPLEAALRAAKGNGAGDDGLAGKSLTFERDRALARAGRRRGAVDRDFRGDRQIRHHGWHQRDAAALGVVFESHPRLSRHRADLFHRLADQAVRQNAAGKGRQADGPKANDGEQRLAAFLARVIEKHRPTVLIDEFDATIAGDQAMAETLRGQLNSSFDRDGANIGKCVPLPGGGYDEREFSTWAATWIAGIRKIPDTIEDRSVVFRLKRKLASEKVARFRGKDGGELDRPAAEDRAFRRRQRAAPARDRAEHARGAERGRRPRADAWEPLIAIADVAGGDWPQRGRNAALALCRADDEEDAERNVHVVLLADIRDIFARLFPEGHPAHNQEGQGGRPDDGPRLLTKQLLDELHGLEERPWVAWGKSRKPLTDTGLASLLRPYGVHSSTVREPLASPNVRGKGYFLRSFKDVFSRYLPSSGLSTRANVPNPANAGENEVFEDVPNRVWYGSENAGNASNSGLCDVVST